MSRINTTATEYRYLRLTVAPIDGDYPTLTQGAVKWRITGPDHAGTLHPIDRLVPGAQGEWYAGLLVGPDGLPLAKGTYWVQAQIVDSPETVEPQPAQRLEVI